MISVPTLIVVVIVGLYLLSSIKILPEYERGVIFRLGRLLPEAKGPGIFLVFALLRAAFGWGRGGRHGGPGGPGGWGGRRERMEELHRELHARDAATGERPAGA